MFRDRQCVQGENRFQRRAGKEKPDSSPPIKSHLFILSLTGLYQIDVNDPIS
jgi:hypothetical protein